MIKGHVLELIARVGLDILRTQAIDLVPLRFQPASSLPFRGRLAEGGVIPEEYAHGAHERRCLRRAELSARTRHEASCVHQTIKWRSFEQKELLVLFYMLCVFIYVNKLHWRILPLSHHEKTV